MKKICYITTVSITIKSFFVEQLKYLAEEGYKVYVICSYDESLYNILGDKINYIPVNMPRGLNLFQSIKAIIDMCSIFKKEEFDLIQYSTPNAALYASLTGWIMKVPVRNYHLMGLRFEGNKGILRFILKTLERISCLLSTDIECVSHSLLKTCIKYKLFTDKKAIVVWNGSSGGVDLTRFNYTNKNNWRKKIRNFYHIDDDTLVYGFVGRITKDKGIDDLLFSFKNLEINIDSRLMLIGEFENIENLDSELINWSLSNKKIVFTGFKKNVEEYLSAIDVLILPSYREGFGNVIIEAESLGIPVIVSNIYGPVDAMKNNYSGFLFELGNLDDLISKMSQISNKKIRDEFSNNAYLFATHNFDSKVLCKYILKRKQNLLSK